MIEIPTERSLGTKETLIFVVAMMRLFMILLWTKCLDIFMEEKTGQDS